MIHSASSFIGSVHSGGDLPKKETVSYNLTSLRKKPFTEYIGGVKLEFVDGTESVNIKKERDTWDYTNDAWKTHRAGPCARRSRSWTIF